MKPIEETEKEKEVEAHNKDSHRLFQTSKWTVASRDNEPPEVEYLSTVLRGSKRKINGKFVEIEEEEHSVHHDLTGGIQVMSGGGQGMKRRPPPPRRKPGKGRKAGFKKMVSFAEDGRALPAGESGVAAPPPPIPLSPPQEYLNEPIPTSLPEPKEIKMEPVGTEEKEPETVGGTSPSLPPTTTTQNDQSVETIAATRLDSDIEMGDDIVLSNVNVESHIPLEPTTVKPEEAFTEPKTNTAQIPPIQATSISPPHIPEFPPLPDPTPAALPVPKAISPSLPERSPSLPPRPVFTDERPQGLPERPSFLDANRPPGLPPKPSFLDGPKLQLSQSPVSVPPPISSLLPKKVEDGEISEGEVDEATS